MVLSDQQIIDYCIGYNMIEPYNTELVNPASYDLTLSYDIIEIHAGGIVDASTPHNLTTTRKITLQYGQKYLLQPGTFILASSLEYVKIPPELAAEVKLKSSTARAGIGHMFAGWIDPGFEGNITFELFSHVPVWLQPGKPVCQIAFLHMSKVPIKPYSGRYQNQVGPTPAREVKQLEFADFIKQDKPFQGKPFFDIAMEPRQPRKFAGLEYAVTRGYDETGKETLEDFERKKAKELEERHAILDEAQREAYERYNVFLQSELKAKPFITPDYALGDSSGVVELSGGGFTTQMILDKSIDHIWQDGNGDVVVKTPDGTEHRLTKDEVLAKLGKHNIHEIVASFISNIIEDSPNPAKEVPNTYESDNWL